MNLEDRNIKKRLRLNKHLDDSGPKMQATIQKSKKAFLQNEEKSNISQIEFLYQQSRYIHKRYWLMQAVLLLILWFVLQISDSSYLIQRCMGISASLFAILLLPELWKNINSNALEIEGASYFTLRQIYSARILFLALIDVVLLCTFSIPIIISGQLQLAELVIQFFLPYLVTCCICFRTLNNRRMGSEALSLLLCIIWCVLWTQIVLHAKVYTAISLPVWITMTTVAFFYLGYCICKAYKNMGGTIQWN